MTRAPDRKVSRVIAFMPLVKDFAHAVLCFFLAIQGLCVAPWQPPA